MPRRHENLVRDLLLLLVVQNQGTIFAAGEKFVMSIVVSQLHDSQMVSKCQEEEAGEPAEESRMR
jgi:hypothetical protein